MTSPDPGCGICRSLVTEPPLWSDRLWQVRHIEPPWGVAGWMLQIARRPAAGEVHVDPREVKQISAAYSAALASTPR